MAGVIARCAGVGGKFFAGMIGDAGGTDFGIVDICLSGNQNDTIVTGLKITPMISSPDGTIAPPGWAIRWALTAGPDVSQGLSSFAILQAATIALGAVGGSNGEYAYGTDGLIVSPWLPSGASVKVLAQGFAYGNINDPPMLWPVDPEASGALIIHAGEQGQLLLCGPVATTGGAATGNWAAALTIAAGPVRKIRESSGKGLPVAHLIERG